MAENGKNLFEIEICKNKAFYQNEYIFDFIFLCAKYNYLQK